MNLNLKDSTYEVIVIGAGQAGLGISYFLKKNELNHVVFEKGRIGESWLSQRWDSFALNTPNHLSVLPGDNYTGSDPEAFLSSKEFAGVLEKYALRFQLPVSENSKVVALEQNIDPLQFNVSVSENGNVKDYFSRQVVIASGSMNGKKIPSFSDKISTDIYQLHTSEYKNSAQLPKGSVLVVGSAQSGCQIAEDLLDEGRKVFLSTSMVPRAPRRYRGKDMVEWFSITKFFDLPTEEVTDPQILAMKQPQISGLGKLGHTVSLQYLAKRGATILGKLEKAEKTTIYLQPNAALHVKFADDYSMKIKGMVDSYIQQNEISAPQPEKDDADLPDPTGSCASSISSLDLIENDIHSIIWTTGFGADFSWIKVPVLDNDGNPKHKNGISEIEGLYFIGFPWLRKRKSGIILGIKEDAEFIANEIMKKHSD
jgi:putative flavoprotein involved in K+ transport